MYVMAVVVWDSRRDSPSDRAGPQRPGYRLREQSSIRPCISFNTFNSFLHGLVPLLFFLKFDDWPLEGVRI